MNFNRFIPSTLRDYRTAALYLKKFDNRNDSRTAEIQLQRLQETWNDCVTDVPYYAKLVKRGDAPREIRGWSDFQAVPELNRSALQKHRKDFIRLSGPPDVFRATGGSTGEPIQFGVSKAEDATLRVLKLALWLRMGYVLGSRFFLIWGHNHLLGKGWWRHWNHAVRKIKDDLLGYQRVDANCLWPERCEEIARRMIAFRPDGLIGYTSALDYFLRTTTSFYADFKKLGLKFVMPSGEMAPRPDSFQLMREVFGCPVIQEFGGLDFGQVAMKVDEQPFEVFSDHNILEAIPDAAGSSEGGAAVVTPLYRRYTPLIRYRQGDVIEGVNRLEHGHVITFRTLAGRINDMVELPTGQRIHSVALLCCVREEPLVLNTQLILEESGVHLRLVTAPNFDSSCEQRIRYRLGQLSPVLSGIPFVRVQDVETSVAGKRRWFVDKRSTAGKPSKVSFKEMKVAVGFRRLGPYHHARLAAAGRQMQIYALEACGMEDSYAWEKIEGAENFHRITLTENFSDNRKWRQELRRHMFAELDKIQPDAVVVPGWASADALAALQWSLRHRVPVVCMSESTAWDKTRNAWRETVKRQIVRLFSSALVGGSPQADYLVQLGMPRDRIFLGYDVVDNEHFQRGASRAQANAGALRAKLGVPENYFLASSRFVEKKNLPRLLSAFAAYKDSDSAGAWSLVLLGDGPLRPQIEDHIRQLNLGNHVTLPGFKQYQDLPAYYGLARAFVHASTSEQWGLVVNEAMAAGLPVLVSKRCGCAADLVVDGRNGFVFNPFNVDEIAAMLKLVASGGCDLQTMGAASREIIADWSPAKFADGMHQAVECALRTSRSQPGLLERFTVQLLTRV